MNRDPVFKTKTFAICLTLGIMKKRAVGWHKLIIYTIILSLFNFLLNIIILFIEYTFILFQNVKMLSIFSILLIYYF